MDLIRLTGFNEGNFPVTYLGAPLSLGCMTTRILEKLVQKIENKVVNWKWTLSSQVGRLILRRHVLFNMLIHTLVVICAPRLVINKIILLFPCSFGMNLMVKQEKIGCMVEIMQTGGGKMYRGSKIWVRFRKCSS